MYINRLIFDGNPVDKLLGYGENEQTTFVRSSTEELSPKLRSGTSRERISDDQIVSEIYE